MSILFNIELPNFKLKQKTKLKSWIKTIIALEKKITGTINFVFVSDETLLKKNKQYLKHKTLTDIITFDYSEGTKISGDILISIDRVTDNANKFKVSFEEELNRVIIHGILHLCGYGDKTKIEAETMRKKENWALNKYFAE